MFPVLSYDVDDQDLRIPVRSIDISLADAKANRDVILIDKPQCTAHKTPCTPEGTSIALVWLQMKPSGLRPNRELYPILLN